MPNIRAYSPLGKMGDKKGRLLETNKDNPSLKPSTEDPYGMAGLDLPTRISTGVSLTGGVKLLGKADQIKVGSSVPDLPLDGLVALVTGSTSGIGLAIAEALLIYGAKVALHGSEEGERQVSVFESLQERYGGAVSLFTADLSKEGGAEELAKQVQAELGGVDILVNNAGFQHVSPVESFPSDIFSAMMMVMVEAPMVLARAFLLGMVDKGFGRIINISSVHGHVASVNKSGYVTAKHALEGMTKEVALETAGTGVTVNSVAPGWVRTPLVEKQIEEIAKRDGLSIEEAAKKLLSNKQPIGRFITPEEVANAVLFLVGRLAGAITGTSLVIDGGWTAQ